LAALVGQVEPHAQPAGQAWRGAVVEPAKQRAAKIIPAGECANSSAADVRHTSDPSQWRGKANNNSPVFRATWVDSEGQ